MRKKISFSGKGFEENNSSKEEKPPPPLHLSLPPRQMALVLAPTCTLKNRGFENEELE